MSGNNFLNNLAISGAGISILVVTNSPSVQAISPNIVHINKDSSVTRQAYSISDTKFVEIEKASVRLNVVHKRIHITQVITNPQPKNIDPLFIEY